MVIVSSFLGTPIGSPLSPTLPACGLGQASAENWDGAPPRHWCRLEQEAEAYGCMTR